MKLTQCIDSNKVERQKPWSHAGKTVIQQDVA